MPDLRGLFLRGYGSQAHAQNNGSTVGLTTTLHESGKLGQIQGDAIRNIAGETGRKLGVTEASGLFTVSQSGGTDVNGNGMNGWSLSKEKFSASTVVPTANENRPVNTAVRYLVRARP